MSETTAVSRPRPAGVVRWAWLLVLVGGVVAYLVMLRTLVVTQNPLYVPSLLLLGSAVVPASVLVYAASGRRGAGVSASLIALTAAVGGVFGTVAAGTLEYDTMRRLGTVPMIAVGLIEETVKLVVPLVVLLVLRRRALPAAGVVVGVASGMGFATLETMGYGFSALLQSRSLAGLDSTLLLRGLLAPAGHVAWTGITTAALWALPAAARRGRTGSAVLVLVGAFVGSVTLHAIWDGTDSVVVRAVVGLVSFGALLLVVRRSRRAPWPADGVAPGPAGTAPAPAGTAPASAGSAPAPADGQPLSPDPVERSGR